MQKIQRSACVVILSFLFLQSELPTEVFRRVEDLFELRRFKKNILKKIKKYFVSSKKVFTFALANENGTVLSLRTEERSLRY